MLLVSTWLCSRAKRFQSILTISPLLTAQWQSIRVDRGGLQVQISSGSRIVFESTFLLEFLHNFNIQRPNIFYLPAFCGLINSPYENIIVSMWGVRIGEEQQKMQQRFLSGLLLKCLCQASDHKKFFFFHRRLSFKMKRLNQILEIKSKLKLCQTHLKFARRSSVLLLQRTVKKRNKTP